MDTLHRLQALGCLYARCHVIGTGGRHLGGYCNLDPLLPYTSQISELVEAMVLPFKDSGVQTIFVPAVGAIPLGNWGAHHLTQLTGSPVTAVWADKDASGTLQLTRAGFARQLEHRRVLILEDMINQMHSVRRLVQLAVTQYARVVGVATIVANEAVSADAIGVRQLVSLSRFAYPVWSPEACAQSGPCSRQEPLAADLGHPGAFLDAHPGYPRINLLNK